MTGLVLLTMTIRMFIGIGNGTIKAWDPSRVLIVASLYSHVRYPMILSTIILQVGEAIFFTSKGIAVLAILNLTINTVYFIYSEEPGLVKRFGGAFRKHPLFPLFGGNKA